MAEPGAAQQAPAPADPPLTYGAVFEGDKQTVSVSFIFFVQCSKPSNK